MVPQIGLCPLAVGDSDEDTVEFASVLRLSRCDCRLGSRQRDDDEGEPSRQTSRMRISALPLGAWLEDEVFPRRRVCGRGPTAGRRSVRGQVAAGSRVVFGDRDSGTAGRGLPPAIRGEAGIALVDQRWGAVHPVRMGLTESRIRCGG